MKTLCLASCLAILLLAVPSLQAQCPPGLPPGTTCMAGQDTHGAFYLIAVPALYNGRLVLWNHGYSLSAPAPLAAADLGPGAALLQLGFATAASSFRPDAVGLGGWVVRDGAEDTENLRQRFVQVFGQPNLTFVVGASEGGLVTEEIAERFGRQRGENGKLNYDGCLPLCGPLAGGLRNWYGGFDLRVVYQFYCQNLPLPSEPQYPLYFGLDPNGTLTANDVATRINQCTGVLQPPFTRTPLQSQNLSNILGVAKIPESFLITDMFFSTFALQELVLVRTFGQSPVTNIGVLYSGSTDDAALNAGVFRAAASDGAEDFLESAYDPNGHIPMPTLTTHTIGDGLVIVENENDFRGTVAHAHRLGNLQQNFVDASGHCQFTNSEVLASFQALVAWVETKQRPTRAEVAALCQQDALLLGDTCNFNLKFEPRPFDTRVLDRPSD